MEKIIRCTSRTRTIDCQLVIRLYSFSITFDGRITRILLISIHILDITSYFKVSSGLLGNFINSSEKLNILTFSFSNAA